MHQYIERVVDLLPTESNHIWNMPLAEAQARVLSANPSKVREIEGSFALIARDGKTVRMARSLDRPMRYFLAKRQEGPALVVAERIDQIKAWLNGEGFASQFVECFGTPIFAVGRFADRSFRRSQISLRLKMALGGRLQARCCYWRFLTFLCGPILVITLLVNLSNAFVPITPLQLSQRFPV